MTVPIERATAYSGMTEKKPWTAPVLETILVRSALGAQAGSKCDKFGSLSHGGGHCPK
ncbi:MAG TPA: hypothetical protein VMQ60_04305 [Acidobacteriaceae bacterium]|nr:hypothetical protein [Acidobacteriaceae bacterium]